MLPERSLAFEASEMSASEIGEDDVEVRMLWGLRDDLRAFLNDGIFFLLVNGISENT